MNLIALFVFWLGSMVCEESVESRPPSIASFDVLWLNPEEGIHAISYGNLNEIAVSVMNTALPGSKDDDDLVPFVRVTSIEASLRRFNDFRSVIQNFSHIRPSTELRPQERATFDYYFGVADPYVAAVKAPVGLVVTVRYATRNQLFEVDVVNSTVLIKDDYRTLDLQLVFLLLVLGGIGFLVGYWTYGWFGKKYRRTPFAGLGTRKSNDQSRKNHTSANFTKIGKDVDLDWISRENLKLYEDAQKRSVGKTTSVSSPVAEDDSGNNSDPESDGDQSPRKRR